MKELQMKYNQFKSWFFQYTLDLKSDLKSGLDYPEFVAAAVFHTYEKLVEGNFTAKQKKQVLAYMRESISDRLKDLQALGEYFLGDELKSELEKMNK